MMKQTLACSLVLCVCLIITACASTPPPRIVYQDVRTAIELREDPQAGTGHTHPANFQIEQMVRILSGVRLQSDRQAAYRMLAGEAETVAAFTVAESVALAPHFVKAFSTARPDEVVTFYLRVSDASIGLAYTTGGLFLRTGGLYLALANYRQPPSDAMSGIIPAYEIDPYDSPLLPLKRAGYTVSFSPSEAEVHPVKSQWKWNFPDPGKVVIINPALIFLGAKDSADKIQPRSEPAR